MKELIILGQGPAGISAALYAVRGGAGVTVIAKDDGALAKADKIENYYGFENGIFAKDLIRAGIQQAKNLGVKFVHAEVCGIEFGENGYDIKTSENQTFHAASIVIAVGTSRNTPKIENLQAFEGKGISYCAICDGFFFRGKKVGVIGNAAYAFSEYSVLKNIIDDVTILTDGKQPAFSSANYNPKKIQKFEGNETLERVIYTDGTEEAFDGIFIACGSAGAFELAKKLGMETADNKILIDEKCATNVPGIFAAGDCTKGLQQIAKAVYEGMIAGIQAVQYLKTLS